MLQVYAVCSYIYDLHLLMILLFLLKYLKNGSQKKIYTTKYATPLLKMSRSAPVIYIFIGMINIRLGSVLVVSGECYNLE